CAVTTGSGYYAMDYW
nr:immunoglobulin heavy chain junction region [Mus musculus]